MDAKRNPAFSDPWPTVEIIGALLVVLGGVATGLAAVRGDGMQLLPLMVGLVMLLLSAARVQPLKLGFLLLLLLSLRVYLHGDDRYLSDEITLTDYGLVLISFSATLGRGPRFWKAYLSLFAVLIATAGIISLFLEHNSQTGALFTAGGLDTGQTVFLFGACLTISLSFLWREFCKNHRIGSSPESPSLPSSRNPAMAALWLSTSLASAFLLQAALPWRGLCLPMVSTATVILVMSRKTLLSWMDAWSQRRFASLHPSRTRATLAGILLIVAGCSGWILLHHSPTYIQNLLPGIVHRLDRLNCFFGAVFSNGYRFIYGLGFTNTSSWLCDPSDLEPGFTFAHNMFAQIAADNGFFALAVTVMISLLLWRRSWQLSGLQACSVMAPVLSLALYCFLFLQLDAGWGQASFLQVMIGFVIGSLTLRVPPAVRPSSPPRAAACR